MRRTLYDVTVEELEWLRNFEIAGPTPTRSVRLIANNFVRRMVVYEKKHEAELVDLYKADYQDILDKIVLSQDHVKMIDWVMDYNWSEKTFVMVMGNQLVETWCVTLVSMTPDNIRASIQAVIEYVKMGLHRELFDHPLSPKHGINIGQALAMSNAMGIVLRAIEIAIERKKKDVI